jgi:restriction system protein
MPIPDYESLMLPVLKIASDGQEHRIGDVVEQLARDFGLTDEERQHLLPSGKQATFANRVHWARTYLAQAKLLEPTRRAHFKITDRGRQALAEAPTRIDNLFLSRFAEFIAFRARTRETEATSAASAPMLPAAAAVDAPQTPDELLRSTVKQIELSLRKNCLTASLLLPLPSSRA